MGIFLQQEMGVIGLLPADVSAYVIDQREAGTACSSLICLLELNLTYCSLFVDILSISATRGHYIIRVINCTDEDIYVD